MFNIDNSLRFSTREDKPMAPRRLKVGQGFSLFDLKDVISDVTDTLGNALAKQGVDVSKDQLFLRLQNLVQDVGTSNGFSDGYGSVMSASDKVPYSIAGDMMVIAYEHYKNGEEKKAIKNMIAAMGSEDFEAIANGILLMNKKSDLVVQADDSSDTDDTDETEDSDDDLTDDDDSDDTDADSDDTDTDEDADDDDLEDSDIDDAVSDTETTASDEDKDEDEEDEDTEESDKPTTDVDSTKVETKPEVEKKPTPMGRTSSEITASHTSKVLANKLSLDGSALSRAKAKEFLNKNRNL